MTGSRLSGVLTLVAVVTFTATCADDSAGRAAAHQGRDGEALTARVVAVGIPGAGPITTVGRFLPGGPIHDKPEFKAFTEPGRVLEPDRLLVGSVSNFGAEKAIGEDMPGSILSIDARGTEILHLTGDFATSGGQAAALDGAVQLYSGQAAAFLNAVTNPQAVTASHPGVSNMLDIAINNAFGRPWPANAPRGLDEPGSATILDPGGMPLAGAPNSQAGGVFFGDATNRQPAQVIEGALNSGAMGTAFLGRALDDPKRAVFAVVTADGAISQAHSEKGIHGLAPAGTISDLRGRRDSDQFHVGAVLKYYTPEPVLYLSDPVAEEVVALTLPKDEVGKVRKAGHTERFKHEAFDMPVDLAPTVSESSHRDWSSNTTLAELADIYVLNRGNNTISRMKVDGTLIATRHVSLPGNKPLGAAKVNGIATSLDGTKIYLTLTGKLPGYNDEGGALLELPSFIR